MSFSLPRWLAPSALVAVVAAAFYLPGQLPDKSVVNSVYFCDSQYAVAYHKSAECNALGQCTHEVVTMSADAAQKRGRHACHHCY